MTDAELKDIAREAFINNYNATKLYISKGGSEPPYTKDSDHYKLMNYYNEIQEEFIKPYRDSFWKELNNLCLKHNVTYDIDWGEYRWYVKIGDRNFSI